jgi:bla regulator protein blaR1
MITYIFKTILCSALLILIYFLLLEREKIHRFNRFYLLFSMAFSFIIPLITIKTRVLGFPISETINLTNSSLQNTVSQIILPSVNNNFTLSNILLLIYVGVTTFFFCRFIINILTIFFKIKNNSSVQYLEAKIVLTKENQVPHSFLKYVFVHFNDFKSWTIEKEILSHELAHVKQKHSIDILFIELLMIFDWINPIIFLYRKAVQLNHEFLADEFVVNTFCDSQRYQLLLLNKATQTNNLILSSPFNYLITKKRIIMMSKKASFRVTILKQIVLLPLIAVIGFSFATKITAQVMVDSKELQYNEDGKFLSEFRRISGNDLQIRSTQEGVPQELLKEYQNLINKYKRTLKDGRESYSLNLTKADKERLEKIFFQMSKEQQDKQMFVFLPNSSMVLKRLMPTKEQLESYKDPKMYGVWIDGERVNNDVLSNYQNTDFAHVFESILMKNATNYGKHVYQVDLMTNDYYQNYYNKQISDKEYTLMIRDPKRNLTK